MSTTHRLCLQPSTLARHLSVSLCALQPFVDLPSQADTQARLLHRAHRLTSSCGPLFHFQLHDARAVSKRLSSQGFLTCWRRVREPVLLRQRQCGRTSTCIDMHLRMRRRFVANLRRLGSAQRVQCDHSRQSTQHRRQGFGGVARLFCGSKHDATDCVLLFIPISSGVRQLLREAKLYLEWSSEWK